MDITVAIPSIPPRGMLLSRAITSVAAQTKPAKAISVAIDTTKEGAPPTRQRALDAVRTPYVAFLDDDDEFLPTHLEDLARHMEETGADIVYSWFKVVGRGGFVFEEDPVFPPGHYLNEFDPENPIETTVTTLVRTELAKEVGFRALDRGHDANTGEDYGFILGCVKAGASIKHLVKKTWLWHHDSGNTSGRPDRW
ncbi:MAG TPA: glycosyltransferase [Pyrinomonadaceae bacterium]|nr:glycosyltransferase [Pyrinomonadaceae bacterium]